MGGVRGESLLGKPQLSMVVGHERERCCPLVSCGPRLGTLRPDPDLAGPRHPCWRLRISVGVVCRLGRNCALHAVLALADSLQFDFQGSVV